MNADCIMVLGCKVRDDGLPGAMLQKRLERGTELYHQGAAPKMLMTGDHGRESYDEVNSMKRYAVEAEVPATDVFMDHAGFSTYESIYRARDVFGVDRMVIVSQEYHLYRALHIARKLGVEAYGVAADGNSYASRRGRLREVLARAKDMVFALVQPEPTYLGPVIPISGDGNQTNDE